MAKTPKGVFKFAHLNTPDTKFNAEGEYNVSVALDKDDPKVKAFLAKVDKEHAAAGEQAQEKFDELKPAVKKKLAQKRVTEALLMPYYQDELDDNDEPTGRIIIRFKTKAQFTSKKTGKTIKKVVPFFDGKGTEIMTSKRPLVYGGTIGQVDFTTMPNFIPATGEAFLSLYLNSIRISKLATAGAGGDWDEDEDSDFSQDELPESEGDDIGGGDDDDLDGDLGDLDGDLGDDDDDDEIPF